MRFLFALSLFLFTVRFFFLPRVFFFLPHGEVIHFAVSLFLFAVRFSFCSEVNAFAMTVVGHRHGNKVRQTTSNWIVRILYEAT